jgi:hypothetical protein
MGAREKRVARYGDLRDFQTDKGPVRAASRADAIAALKAKWATGPKFTPSLRSEPRKPVEGVEYLGTRAVVRSMNRGGAL